MVNIAPGRYTKGTLDPSHYPGLRGASLQDSFIDISTDGLVLDLSGAVLDGEGTAAVGISVHDCRNVTIRYGAVVGFHYGIHATNVTSLTIHDCVVSDNTNPLDAGWLPDIEEPIEEGFGGGIYLFRVSVSVIRNNLTGNNFNGISLVRSDRNLVEANRASYCGNVGIYLLESSHNRVLNNQAEHCIRYTDRFWNDTADSAGILLEKNSHHNRIIGNSLRYSGDGFFIRANPNHSSDYNFVQGNDGSFSPNNGFEAVFSVGNIFSGNVANYCNYGFWLGYSADTSVLGNEIHNNRQDGIAIDRGRGNRIQGNNITGNLNGIRLWGEPWDPPDRNGSAGSGTNIISGNTVANSRRQAISIESGPNAKETDNTTE